jgi:hypothetical protein
MDRLLALRARYNARQVPSSRMDDEMFHRYEQFLIDEAATSVASAPRSDAETGGLVRWI